MNKLLSRMSMAALLAASCFLVAGCSEGEAPATGGPSAASSSESGSSTSTEKADETKGGSESK